MYIYAYINKICAYISPICREGEAPHGLICLEFDTGGLLADVINSGKFYLSQVRGFDSVGNRIFTGEGVCGVKYDNGVFG